MPHVPTQCRIAGGGIVGVLAADRHFTDSMAERPSVVTKPGTPGHPTGQVDHQMSKLLLR
jgi:hypothetical protein